MFFSSSFYQATKYSAEKAQVTSDVQQLFDTRPSGPTHLQYLFKKPLAQMLQQTTHALWVNSFKPVLTMNYTDALTTR